MCDCNDSCDLTILPGSDGVGISSITDNGDGTLTINYTDGNSYTTPDFTGPTGAAGANGADGADGELLVISDTYANIATAKAGGTLTPYALYHISDKNYFLFALSTTQLAVQGYRLQTILQASAYIPAGTNLGVWYSGLTPNIGDTVVWGGKQWSNTSGSVGSAVDNISLSGADWSLTGAGTRVKTFQILYDFDNDWVSRQFDDRGNVLGLNDTFGSYTYNPVDLSDWGDDRITNNDCFEIINNVFPSSNKIEGNICKGSIEKNRITTNGNILYNIASSISTNVITNSIEGNKCDSTISLNTCTGIQNNKGNSIVNNSNNGLIRNNVFVNINLNNSNVTVIEYNVVKTISSNTNSGSISNNICKDITSNSGNCTIQYNNISGNINNNVVASANIEYNTNGGDIDSNTVASIISNNNNGSISDNIVDGAVSFNQNNGTISNNTDDVGFTLQITQNYNNGSIEYNNATASISINNNINNGNIGNVGGPVTNRAANIADAIVNK